MNEIFQFVFAHMCHQDPERTIWINGVDLGICWRCAGLHFGVALGWCYGTAQRARESESILNNGSWALLLGPLLLFLHWFIGSVNGHESEGLERLAVGLVAGISMGIWMAVTARNIGVNRTLRWIPSVLYVALLVVSTMVERDHSLSALQITNIITGSSALMTVALAIMSVVAIASFFTTSDTYSYPNSSASQDP